jgi:PIN domain nuclease of toxin-antitoxin system
MDVRPWLRSALDGAGILCLPVTPEIAVLSTELAPHHKDPADRLIIATAIAHDAVLINFDGVFPKYTELAGRLLTNTMA